MKRLVLIFVILTLAGCTYPVLKRDILKEGSRNVSFDVLRTDPERYKGKLFILGGIIAGSKITDEGTILEAMYVPVDSDGYLKGSRSQEGRYLAIFPKSAGYLDPMIYKRGRSISMAGDFVGTRTGKLDESNYVYPVFSIVQIHLWTEEDYYGYYYPSYGYPYYGYPYGPYWYGNFSFGYPYWGWGGGFRSWGPGPFWP